MKKKIVITGGGTGGHVFPAIAMAEGLRERGWEVIFVGSPKGFESRIVPEKGFPIYYLSSGAVKNQSPLTILRTLFKLGTGVLWSMGFLWKQKPQAVLGVGGYVSFPVCFASFLVRIPLLLQEQNVSVGIANRILGKFARRVFLGFEKAKKYFPPQKVLFTGNPLRKEIQKSTSAGSKEKLRILIMGGSQGAKAINEALMEHIEQLSEDFEVVHQTGEKDFERVQKAYQQKARFTYRVAPFLKEVYLEYQKADLVIGRSGALTVSELIEMELPSLLVPYPRQGQNDQVDNAKMLESHGVSRMVEQGDGFQTRFWETFLALADPDRLAKMRHGFSNLRTPKAVDRIVDSIEKELS